MRSRLPHSVFRFFSGFILALLAANLFGQNQPEERLPDAIFSPAVSEGMSTRLAPLLQGPGERFDLAIPVIDDLLKLAAPGSYDEAQLNWMKARMLLNQDRYAEASALLESAIQIVDRYPHFIDSIGERVAMLLTAAQSLAQQANETPAGPAQKELFSKAAQYMRRYVRESPRLSPQEITVYIVSLLNLLPENGVGADPALVAETEQAIRMGLSLQFNPNFFFYQYLVGVFQRTNRLEEAAQYLELLSRALQPRNPEQPADGGANQIWRGLANGYLQIAYTYSNDDPADGPKDLDKAEMFNVRALNAYQRAQRQGYLTSSQDYMNVVGTYATLGQFGLAAEVLDACLHDGRIESNERNWSALASYYQAIYRPQKVIDVMKEAAARFPESGNFDYQVSQAYLELDDIPLALEAAREAVRKGVPNRNGQIWLSIAYYEFSLDHLEQAMEAVNKATEFPDGAESPQLESFRTAIQESLDNRRARENR